MIMQKSKPVLNLLHNCYYNPVNIAIVDTGIILFKDKMMHTLDIAIKKANSSAGIPVPTRLIEELVYGKDSGG